MKLLALVTDSCSGRRRDDKFDPLHRSSAVIAARVPVNTSRCAVLIRQRPHNYSTLTFRRPPRHGDTAAVVHGKVGDRATISERTTAEKCEERLAAIRVRSDDSECGLTFVRRRGISLSAVFIKIYVILHQCYQPSNAVACHDHIFTDTPTCQRQI